MPKVELVQHEDEQKESAFDSLVKAFKSIFSAEERKETEVYYKMDFKDVNEEIHPKVKVKQ